MPLETPRLQSAHEQTSRKPITSVGWGCVTVSQCDTRTDHQFPGCSLLARPREYSRPNHP
eukprot:13787612-Alexandrium_andersonii.AAC.1